MWDAVQSKIQMATIKYINVVVAAAAVLAVAAAAVDFVLFEVISIC